MKIKTEIDIAWIDEEQSVDDAVRESLIGAVVTQIEGKLLDGIKKQATDRMLERVDQLIDQILHNFMDREVQVTDKWGDVIERFESVNELLKGKFDGYLTAQVDRNGKPTKGCAYESKTRIEHEIDTRIQKAVTSFEERIRSNLNDLLKTKLTTALSQTVSRSLAKTVDIEALIAGGVK